MSADMAALGWSDGPIVMSGFVEPFDTWADMRHLLARETWRSEPRALAYFCNVLPDVAPALRDDPAYPAAARAQVRRNAVEFLDRQIQHVWPNARGEGGGFPWRVLVDPDPGAAASGTDDAGRFASQFWTANVNPSDRYVLSVPGSSKFRISPLDATYDNLTIAGDWTECGFNAGCVEAAVMSGRLAAHALSKFPPPDDILGFDHP
jgi:uncharacterized protein with NAD-binding domain and iron-sulfur cluster